MLKISNILIFGLILFSSCSDESGGPLQQIHADQVTPWIRYEHLLSEIDTVSPKAGIHKLFELYPEFSKVYFSAVINNLERPDTVNTSIFKSYASSAIINLLVDTIDHLFPKLDDQEQIFSDGMARLKHLVPEVSEPKVFTAISGFSTAAGVLSDSVLLLSPEMYFGRGNKFYDTDTWPLFIQRTMNRQNMASNLLKTYLRFNLLPQYEPVNMLDHMIQQGKEAWLLSQILPTAMDTLVFDYTPRQLKFCRDNEKEIWSYFMREKLVYETNMRKIVKYVNPSPTSPGMPPDAPGRIAAFTGFKIIEAYLARHPKQVLRDFLQERDGRKILEQARYKPD